VRRVGFSLLLIKAFLFLVIFTRHYVAAVAGARWLGKGDKLAADAAAVDAMRHCLMVGLYKSNAVDPLATSRCTASPRAAWFQPLSV
jgi:hypothetical protein